MAWCLVK